PETSGTGNQCYFCCVCFQQFFYQTTFIHIVIAVFPDFSKIRHAYRNLQLFQHTTPPFYANHNTYRNFFTDKFSPNKYFTLSEVFSISQQTLQCNNWHSPSPRKGSSSALTVVLAP